MDAKSYCKNQAELIKREKWIEGERIGRDPGPDFAIGWVKRSAKRYREEHEKAYTETVQRTTEKAVSVLKKKLPSVSAEQWEVVVTQVVGAFVEVWTEELVFEESEERRQHLEEI